MMDRFQEFVLKIKRIGVNLKSFFSKIFKTSNNQKLSKLIEELKNLNSVDIKMIIFAILWLIGLLIFICGLVMHNGQIMSCGLLLSSIYGVIPTIKFIFSLPFDSLTKNKEIKEIVPLGYILNFLILIFLGTTGLGLIFFPLFTIFKIINNLFKKNYLTEEQKNEDIFLVDYNISKYTIVAIYGIFLGIFYFCFTQTTLTVIDELIEGNATILGSTFGQFLSTYTLTIGIIIIILSIIIGYKYGSFTNSPKKYEYIEIQVNGQNYYIKRIKK